MPGDSTVHGALEGIQEEVDGVEDVVLVGDGRLGKVVVAELNGLGVWSGEVPW